MADKRADRISSIRRYERMIAAYAGKAVRPYREDGYVNLITRYGTERDATERYQFKPEPFIADDTLTSFYESSGLFAKIIDAPAEEAVKHGFELTGMTDQNLIEFYEEALDELDWEETAMTAIKWTRLFGGAIAVLLVNNVDDRRHIHNP